MSISVQELSTRFIQRYDRNHDEKVRTSRSFWDVLLFRRPEVGGEAAAFARKVDQAYMQRHYVDRLDLSDWIRQNVDLDRNGSISDVEKLLLLARDRDAFQALF